MNARFVSRTEIASAVLESIRLGAIRLALRSRRDWRQSVFPGFRPDALTRATAMQSVPRFAARPDLLSELLTVYFDDLALTGGYLQERMSNAAGASSIPAHVRDVFAAAAAHERLSDIPLELATSALPAEGGSDKDPPTPANDASEPSLGGEPETTPRPAKFNRDPFDWVPPEDDAASIGAAVTLFSRSLAAFVHERLVLKHGDQWLRRGCGALRDVWQAKADKNTAEVPESLLGYAELPELFEIILRKDNWPVFAPYFSTKKWLQIRADQVIPLRVGGAHAEQRKLYKAEKAAEFRAMVQITATYHQPTADQIDLFWHEDSESDPLNARLDQVTTTGERVEKNFDRLPRPRLLGRGREIGELHEFWKDEFQRVITVTGRGGVGKTALVFEFVNNILDKPVEVGERPSPELVLFLTAKDTWFEGQDHLPESQRFATLRSVLLTLLQHCGHSVDGSEPINELRLAALHELRTIKGLLILDNLESLPDEDIDEIGRFLQQVPSPSKAVVTDRVRRGIGERLGLEGLSVPASVELLESESARRNNAIPSRQRTALARIAEAVNGVPLYLHFIVNLLEKGYKPTEASNYLRGKEALDLLRFSFGSSVATLPPSGREVLYFLALRPTPSTRSDLQQIVRNREDLDGAISELRDAHFLDGVPWDGALAFEIADPQLREFVTVDLPNRMSQERVSAIRGYAGVETTRVRQPNIDRAIRQRIVEAEELARNDWLAAATELEAAIQEYGRAPVLVAKLGYFRYRLHERPRARALLREALAAGYEDFATHHTLGLIYYFDGPVENAVSEAEAALTLIPGDPRASLLLGQALLKLVRRSTLMMDVRRRANHLERARQALRSSAIEDEYTRWQREHNARRAEFLAQTEEAIAQLRVPPSTSV